MPAIAISHAFGRLGCLGAGCCWGELTTLPFGVSYPAGSFAYNELLETPSQASLLVDNHTPLMHATQLYESFGELALFVILLVFITRKHKHGQVVGLWFMCYGLWRFLTEITRGDDARGYLYEVVVTPINRAFAMPDAHITFLSTSQSIALVLITMGVFIFFFLAPWLDRRNAKQGTIEEVEASASLSAQNVAAQSVAVDDKPAKVALKSP